MLDNWFSESLILLISDTKSKYIWIILYCLQINKMNKPKSSPSKAIHKNLNKFNFSSQPTNALVQLISSKFVIRSLQISSNGKTGVIFIQTNTGSFVLKSSNDGPKDQFLNRLAVLMNVHVPQSVCYCCSQSIFHKLIFQIQKFCQQDEVLFNRIKTRLDFPFYQILQYIPSISLAQIGKERFQTHLLSDIKLYSLGMCLGFDLIINNSDRFKLLWGGDGNISNVLIQIKDYDIYQAHHIKNRNNLDVLLGNFVFIDHSGYLLDLKNSMAAKNFQIYIGKVGDFQVKLIRALSEDRPLPDDFQKLKKQFQFYSHYSLTDSDLRKIAHGIVYLTNKFLQIFQSKSIEQLYQNLKKGENEGAKNRQDQQADYWNKYWNKELEKINLGYLQEVYTKLAAIYATYPETVEKIIAEMQQQVEEQVRNPQFNPILHESNPILHESNPILHGSNPKTNSQPNIPKQKQQNNQNISQQPQSLNQIQPQKQQITELSKQQHNEEVMPTQEQLQGSRASKKAMHQQIFKKQKQRKWRDKLAKFNQSNSP